MIKFKDHLHFSEFNHPLENASVTLETLTHKFSLDIDTRGVIRDAAYQGISDPWLSSLCDLVKGKNLEEATQLRTQNWLSRYGTEQAFWDLWAEKEEEIFFLPLELLRGALDKFQGRGHLYLPASPLVCRCFSVREEDILAGEKNRAGMGCRSCRPELQRLLKMQENLSRPRRYFKEMTFADWLVLTDEKLATFPFRDDWQMEIVGFKGQGIVIEYKKMATQREEEEMAKKLQDFLGGALDADLSFFLKRA